MLAAGGAVAATLACQEGARQGHHGRLQHRCGVDSMALLLKLRSSFRSQDSAAAAPAQAGAQLSADVATAGSRVEGMRAARRAHVAVLVAVAQLGLWIQEARTDSRIAPPRYPRMCAWALSL